MKGIFAFLTLVLGAGLLTAAPVANDSKDHPIDSIEFVETPLEMVFKVYGNLVDKTILKDPAAPSPTITLRPKDGQMLTNEDKIEAIETVLEMNGIHLEPYGEKFMRALPRKEARKEGIPLILDAEAPLTESVRVVSLMLPFKNISVEDAQKALDNFKSGSGIIIGFERTNSLLITDTEANINRMREIARAIDIATPVMENVFVRQINYAAAAEIQEALQKIVEDSQKYLEKEGKVSQTAAANGSRPNGGTNGSRLLNRPGTTTPAPTSNESIVMGISDADRGMIRGKVLIVQDERSNKLIIITSKANMDFFDKVIEALDVETTPDVQVKVYRLKYADAEDVSDMINDLIGNSASSKGSSSKGNQNQNAKAGSGSNITKGGTSQTRKPANQRTGEAKAGELNKDNVTVLADERINGLVVMARTEDIPTIESIIESMDIKLSQVLIETVIIEVTLGDTLKTGVDWVRNGRDKTGNTFVKGNMVNGDTGYASMLGGGGGTGSTALNEVMNVTTTAVSSAANSFMGSGANPIGAGVNYYFKSEALNLSAIISASKTDDRSKYIASPVVMTVDNKEATIEATDSRQFLSGWQAVSSSYAGSGLPSPTYTAKDIGIMLKITPKINPNGTVMLEVEEEYSKASSKQTMLSPEESKYVEKQIDVPSTRKMESDVLLENGETVVFGGLTETSTTESETGIPLLKDIPWIGKWLFGSVSQEEVRKELLVFLTPYVLNDSEAAQAEAIRRKKALSDVHAWDDHGWSTSALADPVTKKEQMRRLKDEWKKQDEERQSRLAIEQAKIERAEKLQAMSVEERNLWLKMHEKELDAEAQDVLEEKMMDDKSQAELRALAEQVRQNKLEKAEAELKAEDKPAEDKKSDNE